MMNYLRKAPTLIVIGVTGYVALPIFLADRDPGPPKPPDKPAATAKPSATARSVSMRDPFQVDPPPNSIPASAQTLAAGAGASSSAGGPASLKNSDPLKANVPEPFAEQDKILAGMRLVGTYIDSRDKLAVIDNKVYARGDQLRGADGSMLPYVITDVQKDRALVRRGRREFVIAFSNTPRAGVASAKDPGPTGEAAEAETEVVAQPAAIKAKRPVAKGSSPAASQDPKELIIQQLLAGLANSSGAGSIGGAGAAGAVNPATLAAGLDALMGKNDAIGREAEGSIPSNPAGGTTP
jgi:hypothetical protein